ncbi:glycine zipper 2TM domain-containing protein [Crenobacter cavernae]|uniref:Glycine zipper 2TM domain-containing protein n=1 Tax=Crenobacter cavernae TaxID=2290923 RepID=A0A345Y4J1_9NEIS|nr:glycine zipper 2TM domain-containing protein [Crenobacter cavernae]AXK38843.1 glycine zipper 2TM domain-containing protein [Crenobacter cavernae]
MNKNIVFPLLMLAAGAANAASYTDYATVVKSEPVYEQIQSGCNATAQNPTSTGGLQDVMTAENGGAVLGGLIGGLAGHQVGGGRGKTVATVVGAIGGAMAGRQIAQTVGAKPTPVAQECRPVIQKQLAGYSVTYDYRGHRDTVTLPANPGKRLEMRVSAEPVAR